MRPMKSSPNDPAPSRIAYRWGRLWLRPRVRRFALVWLPVAVMSGLAGAWIMGGDRLQRASDQMVQVRQSIQERPEFMVRMMAVDGASAPLAEDIRDLVPVEFPVSSFDLDLQAMRADIESLDAVRVAGLRIRKGNVLQIDVTERKPAIVWRGPDGLVLLDKTGHRVKPIERRADYAALPVIAGVGADGHVEDALDLLQTASVIGDKLIGLVRVSERRWDIMLQGGVRVMLPQDGAQDALDRVIALDEAQDLLVRDISHIDMRNEDRPTLRLSQTALADLREMRAQIRAQIKERKTQ